MTVPATSTIAAPGSPPVPLYLSSVSRFLLIKREFRHSKGNLCKSKWHERDSAFVKAHPSAFDVRQPKVVPRVDDGERMAVRFQSRTIGRSKWKKELMSDFHVPYSVLKRVLGPSRLRLEVKPDDEEGEDIGSGIDFRPVRGRVKAARVASTGKKILYIKTRGGRSIIRRLLAKEDKRRDKISPNNDAKVWEELFGRYKPDKALLKDWEKALERRGCWTWKGELVSVVEDEIFPRWGKKWQTPDERSGEPEGPGSGDVENELPSSGIRAGNEGECHEPPPFGPGIKRRREENSAEVEDEGARAAKKPRFA